jgi:hypothetical protein
MVLIGNIIALIASLFMVYGGTIKKKKSILIVQCIELSLYTVANAFLGGISGVIINFLGVINNFLEYKKKLNTLAKIILSIVSIVLVVLLNNKGIFGYFPLLCILIYLWSLNIKDVVRLKTMIIITIIFWLIYDFSVKGYISCIFDILTIITNIIAIVQLKRKKLKKRR